MIVSFIIDLFAYVAVSGLCLAVWALTQGSTTKLQHYAQHPVDALTPSFWPIWVLLVWGALLVLHLGVAFSVGLFGRRARRRRANMTREAGKLLTGLASRTETLMSQAKTHPPPPARERRWVTVMFTDIANSTSLNESLGDEEWSRVLAEHRQLVRAAFAGRGGQEVGTQGDGFLGRFPTPGEAVLSAVDIQRALTALRERVGFAPEVRIGIHAGEAVEDEGDLVGRVVNLAARVTTAAEPGEIMVTEPVADYLDGRLELQDRGLRDLKGVHQPRHLLAVGWSSATHVEPPEIEPPTTPPVMPPRPPRQPAEQRRRR